MPNDTKPGRHPHLEGMVGQLAGNKFLIEGARSVIGRDPSQCQIVLTPAVISKVQAAFETDEHGRITLVDLAGKQTTLVNHAPVVRHELNDGDRIGFGVGGVIAFIFHEYSIPSEPKQTPAFSPPRPDLEHQHIPDPKQERFISRLIIPTGPLDDSQPAAFAPGHSAPPPRPYVPAGPTPVHSPTMIFSAAKLPVIRLGRAPDNDFILDAPGVSRYHALLSYEHGEQPMIGDLGSTNGTFVNGEPVTEPRALGPNDLVFLGGFLLHVDGRSIRQHDLSASSITARNIFKQIGSNLILRDVSLAIKPREFVGLMGPSGCGKSTLMDALNGLRPATGGNVLVNDLDLYRNFNALRRSIGYVPQRDVLHDQLTVERTLHYAAQLRLPESTSAAGRAAIVTEVIQTVGLGEQRATPFRQLSGGQQKRLSLAFELITKPSFLFLDEPTSPLDPETTENMMMLFRRLADEGRIVIMVTHKFEKFLEMHLIAILTRGGRLAYFGPPAEALEYFRCRELGDIYRYIAAHDPDELSMAFQRSAHFQRYVAGRITEIDSLSRATGTQAHTNSLTPEVSDRKVGISQFLTLTRRYFEVKLNDQRNTFLLLAQAPVVALVLALIVKDSPVNDAKTLYISAIISIWFGANNAVREIVAESAIYVRERMVNLKIPSYVGSKFAVLAGIALIQCFFFVAIMVVMGRMRASAFLSITFILFLSSMAGIATGLFISALVNSSEKAMSILPLVLIPQLLLSGFMVPVDNVYVGTSGKPATEAQYQRFQDASKRPPPSPNTPPPQATPPEVISKYEGLGAAGYLASVIVARWTLDALAHDVGIEDQEGRDLLATRMTVTAYEKVFEGGDEDEIAAAYRSRTWYDCGVLVFFSLLFLSLTMWALKRKDVL